MSNEYRVNKNYGGVCTIVLHASAVILLWMAGCQYTINGNPDVNLLTVRLSPIHATVPFGGSINLTATVTGSQKQNVIWTLIQRAGTSHGDSLISNGLTAVYQSPIIDSATGPFAIIRVSSSDDPSRAVQDTIWMENITTGSYAVSPLSVTILANSTMQFGIDTLQPGTLAAVTWSITSGPGTITSAGLYFAPSTVPTDSTIVTLLAQSGTDSSTATIVLIKSTDSLRCFSRDVQPILQSCGSSGSGGSGCHDGSSRPAFNYQTTFKDVKPGDARNSRLYQRIIDFNADTRMPLPPSPALTPQQVLTIGQWIDQGALDCQ